MPKTESKPRLSANSACRHCRLRKIKCSGETPCKACLAADIADSCFVKPKTTAAGKRIPNAVECTDDQSVLQIGGAKSGGSPQSNVNLDYAQSRDSQKPVDISFNAPIVDSDFRSSFWDVSLPQSPISFALDQVGPSTHPWTQDRLFNAWQQDFEQDVAGPSTAPHSGNAQASLQGRVHSTGPAYLQPTATSSPIANLDRNPLNVLEHALSEWCIRNDVPVQPLFFQDCDRISNLIASPLPESPTRAEFEDDLLRSLLSAEDSDNLEPLRPGLLSLYARYRALPTALADDQLAVVYASLCIARHSQLRSSVAGGMKDPKTVAREDVTYYRMTRASLTSFGRASITSIWAIFCLVVYVQIHGGAAEYKEILMMYAQQILALGLHRRATAQLYPSQDLGDMLLTSYCYSETFRAVMADLTPAIPMAELELGSVQAPWTKHAEGLIKASNHAVQFLRDYANPQVDMTTAGYVATAEESWSGDLDLLRGQKCEGYPKLANGWAQMRYHWLRFLLHLPRMFSTPGRANQATMYVFRALVNILNIHTEAASMGKLDPSWPQLKRIMVCGQILILCCARNEVHPYEAIDLFSKLGALLRAHVDFWPVAQQAINGFRLAASKLGITLASENEPVFRPADNMEAMDPMIFLDLDLDIFAQIPV